MTSRIIVRAGDTVPDLETVVGCIEFPEHRLQLKTDGSSIRPESEDYPVRAPLARPHHGIELMLLDNVLLPGRFCAAFNFYSDLRGRTVWDLFKALLTDLSPATLRAYLLEIKERHPRNQRLGGIARLRSSDGQDLFTRSYPGSRVFSLAMLGRLAPLTTVPGIWDMSCVKSARANGQFEQLKAKRGVSAMDLLEELVTKNLGRFYPDCDFGWSAKLDYPTRHVSISRHGRPHSSFTLAL
ncbi:hypothetical protein [Paraburkholderia sp. A3RO-2L]|jgi:hypothetical protein|uniref:hypothetical protein n=1 Tax=unclassified Paraburkholderia TaxID=2615204 RepID=UPI003DA9041A